MQSTSGMELGQNSSGRFVNSHNASARSVESVSSGLPKVLVVDDSESNRRVFRRILEGIEVEVVEASGGEEALQLAALDPFVLILLDVQMPDLDGFEVARRLRASEHAQTPIVFVTAAYSDPAHFQSGYSLGAVDYLVTKPIDREVLRNKVEVFLRIFLHQRELEKRLMQAQQENQKLFYENEVFRNQQESLLRHATRDSLTDLPNRLLFEDHLMAAQERARRTRKVMAVIFADVDGLKGVNDLHGHAAGDELLVHVGRRFADGLRASDVVARLGGDEFGLLLEGLEAPDDALMVAGKLIRALEEPLTLRSTLSGKPALVVPHTSMGIALFPEHSSDAQELLMLADLTMYEAKRGGGGVRVYQPGQAVPPTPETVKPRRKRD